MLNSRQQHHIIQMMQTFNLSLWYLHLSIHVISSKKGVAQFFTCQFQAAASSNADSIGDSDDSRSRSRSRSRGCSDDEDDDATGSAGRVVGGPVRRLSVHHPPPPARSYAAPMYGGGCADAPQAARYHGVKDIDLLPGAEKTYTVQKSKTAKHYFNKFVNV